RIERRRDEVHVKLAVQRGVEGGIRLVGLRSHPWAPGREVVLQAGDAARFARGKVGGFANVLRQVEQFHTTILVVFDKLPVAFADRAGGLAALVGVVREMPVETARLRLSATEQKRSDADAVQVGRRSGAG